MTRSLIRFWPVRFLIDFWSEPQRALRHYTRKRTWPTPDEFARMGDEKFRAYLTTLEARRPMTQSYGRHWMGECPDCDDAWAAHVAGIHEPHSSLIAEHFWQSGDGRVTIHSWYDPNGTAQDSLIPVRHEHAEPRP